MGGKIFDVFSLLVCPSSFGRGRENGIAVKPLEFRKELNVVGWENVCNCICQYNVFFAPLVGATTECLFLKCHKILGFLPNGATQSTD